jgi:hypothetical protein
VGVVVLSKGSTNVTTFRRFIISLCRFRW